VGGSKEIPIDVRIIAATNRNLPEAVKNGAFREDLYHRLDLFSIEIPPLRSRGEDILRLAEAFLAKQSKRHRLEGKVISPIGRKNLVQYPWPGNVRELAHELERAIVFEDARELDFDSLARRKGVLPSAHPAGADSLDWFNERYVFPPDGFSLEEAIMRLIRHALAQTNQNVSAAARLLGVSRDYLRYRLSGRASPESVSDKAGENSSGETGELAQS
jgi:DNA-binding NtrC family response regulator